MSTTVLYKALVEAGAPENLADKAAESLVYSDQVATKSDWALMKADLAMVKSSLAGLETRLTWRLSIAAGIVIGAVGLIVKL